MPLPPNPPVRSSPPEFDIVEPLCAVFRKQLKAEGLKYTPERAQVLDTIMRFDGVFEADRIIDDVKGKGFRVSKATVYRTIKLLQEAGIVQRVLLGEEQGYYQLVYGRRPQAMVVRLDRDGASEPVEVPGLSELCEGVCQAHGLTLRSHRLQIFATGGTPNGK